MLYISLIWLIVSFGILLSYFLIKSGSAIVPSLLYNLFLFGKARAIKSTSRFLTKTCQVPKRWFWHFYLGGILMTSLELIVVIHTFFGTGQWPYFVNFILQLLRSPGHTEKGLHSPLAVLITLIMMEIQVIRRFLECLLVSSYSDNTMSLLIYVVGVTYYLAIGLSAITLSQQGHVEMDSVFSDLTWHQILAIVLFIYASWKQNRLSVLMARLRQDKAGQVQNKKHHMPVGDLFDLCSCPHFLMEILIYAAICTMFLWQHEVCNCLFIFVLLNQCLAGNLSHSWYKQNFPKYPKTRTAVIPYIF